MALPPCEPLAGSLQLHTSPPSYVKASVPSEVIPTSPLRRSPAIASILSPPLPEPDSVPEFPILGGIQARGGRGMFAVERHRGAWILMRVQARKDILESKSFLLFLSELLLGYGATLLEGPKITGDRPSRCGGDHFWGSTQPLRRGPFLSGFGATLLEGPKIWPV